MNKLIIFGFLGLLFFTLSCTSVKDMYIRTARENEEMMNYSQARDAYLQAWITEENSVAARGLAVSSFKMRDFEKAESWFARLEKLDTLFTTDLYFYARALAANAKINEAQEVLERCKQQNKDEISSNELTVFEKSLALRNQMVNPEDSIVIEPVEGINTVFSEFGFLMIDSKVCFLSDRLESNEGVIDNQNVFNSERDGWTGNGFLSVFEGVYDSLENSVGQISKAPRYTHNFHIGPVSESEKLIFYSKTTPPRSGSGLSFKKNDLTVYPGIYYRERVTTDSVGPENGFPFNSVLEYVVTDPFWDENTRTLYFASNKPGGNGGTDLYKVVYLGNRLWSEVTNLGTEINTFGDERTPFISSGREFYFSSDGHPGLGGLDIFGVSEFENDHFEVVNLGYPINSNRDDFSYSKYSENNVFLASDRVGGKGSDDIYRVKTIVEEFFILRGKVTDNEDNSPLANVVVTVFNINAGINTRFVTGDDGSFEFKFPLAQTFDKFVLTGSTTGYLTGRHEDALEFNEQEIEQRGKSIDIHLQKIVKEKPYVLDNMVYESGRWGLSVEARQSLTKLAEILEEHPTMKIELHSHTDSKGPALQNKKLSEIRAQAAVDFIVRQGIDPERVKAVGMGEEKLLNRCADGVNCSEEEHSVNRRTEFIITEF